MYGLSGRYEMTGRVQLKENTVLREVTAAMFAAAAAADERMIRRMLGMWVSESDPMIVRDQDGYLLGLTSEDWSRAGYAGLVIAADGGEFPLNSHNNS